MTKAKKISQTTRREIAKYKRDYPKATLQQIADYFNVSARQVQYALDLDERGELARKRGNGLDKRRIDTALKKDTTMLIEEQSRYTLAQLSADENLDPLNRSRAIERVTRSQKTSLDVEMQTSLGGLDWRIYVSTIRRFMPGATRKQILQVYNEERDRCDHTPDSQTQQPAKRKS